MQSEGYGFDTWSVISQWAMSLVCFGFIDDTDLILNSTDPDVTCNDLVATAQQALDTWERLINVTGGALAPEKSYWYLIDVNSDGQYADPEVTPKELILNNKGDPVVIERLAVNAAKEMLGIWSCPDGSMHDEVRSLKAKAKKWANVVWT